ncbi:MAG TPA: ABC transporter permease, partial [Blastocatellia bacterium]|nr:ABC transporter permease [Blastocatellia bacterium]
IGATTAIFSVIDAVLLRPLPYQSADRLVVVREINPAVPGGREGVSPGNFLDLKNASAALDGMTAWYETALTLRTDRDAEQLKCAQVSVEFFNVLRAQAALGHVFQPTETTGVGRDVTGEYAGGELNVVISDSLWRRRFSADPGVIGDRINLNNQDWRITGVASADSSVLTPGVDVFIPWDLSRSYDANRFQAGPPRDWRFLRALARLKPDATIEQAQASLNGIYAGLSEQYPKPNRGWGVGLVPLYDDIVGKPRPALLAIFGAVAILLLIGCANISSLLLTDALARQHEIALRSALGASRRRLVMQLITESTILSLMGGAAGFALACWGLEALVSLAPQELPRLDHVAINVWVLAFTLVVSVAIGVVSGLVPALKGSHTNIATALKEGGARRATVGPASARFQKVMVAGEIAASLVLLAGAGLFVRSFSNILAVDPGFDTRNLLTMHITLDSDAYSGRAAEYYRDLISRLEYTTSVVSAAAVSTLPQSRVGVDFDRPYWRAGDPEPGDGAERVAVRMATPGYFKTIGMALIQGRDFNDQDRPDTKRVIVINERLASRVWPGEDPVGKSLVLDYNRGKYSYEVVGITRGVHYYGLKNVPKPELFIPHAQNPYLPMNVVLRLSTDPAQMTDAVREAVRSVDPTQSVQNVATMEQLLARSMAADRFSMWLMSLLAAIAVVLASAGVYGMISHSVTQRRSEIGIRMALGAQRGDILRMVVTQGMSMTIAGMMIGLAVSFAMTPLIKSLLFGVTATDPLTFAATALLIAVVALVSCCVPAWRATRTDPVAVLRD